MESGLSKFHLLMVSNFSLDIVYASLHMLSASSSTWAEYQENAMSAEEYAVT